MAETPLIILLGNDDDDDDHRALFTEIRRLGGDARRVHPDELVTEVTADGTRFLVDGVELAPDLMFGWVYEDYLILGMNQLETARLAGIPVVNSAMTLLRGQSKYLNSALLHRAGVRHLPVLWGRDEETLVSWTAERGYPMVTKPLMSSRGRGMYRLTDEASVREYTRSLDPAPEQYYVQPFVPAGHRDTRVLCVNHQAVAAVTRIAPEGTWISNAPGNTRQRAELTEELRVIAEQASEAMDALFAGVDVAHDERTGELRVYEVNTCPTCTATFRELDMEPVPLLELASFLVAAARDFHGARTGWRPSVTV
jgi:[lysine-biosynthesis-protein LysW]--L-2-aminoadipate ligase/ribosomal protein S6--L-glutamate ligase